MGRDVVTYLDMRCITDCSNGQRTIGNKNLLKCKTARNISVINVRRIRVEFKTKKVEKNFNTTKTYLLSIVKHKVIHDEQMKDKIEYYQLPIIPFLTSTALRNER